MVGNVQQRVAADAAQVVRELVRGDREEIRLQLARLVEVGQAVQEADEGLLHDVLAGGPVVDAAIDERQQSPLVTRN